MNVNTTDSTLLAVANTFSLFFPLTQRHCPQRSRATTNTHNEIITKKMSLRKNLFTSTTNLFDSCSITDGSGKQRYKPRQQTPVKQKRRCSFVETHTNTFSRWKSYSEKKSMCNKIHPLKLNCSLRAAVWTSTTFLKSIYPQIIM